MTTLIVTANGQVTLKKELLLHMGIRPGQRVHIAKLPDGKLVIQPASGNGSVDDLIGRHAGKTRLSLTLQEMNTLTAPDRKG